jgi:hypothetical protein
MPRNNMKKPPQAVLLTRVTVIVGAGLESKAEALQKGPGKSAGA